MPAVTNVAGDYQFSIQIEEGDDVVSLRRAVRAQLELVGKAHSLVCVALGGNLLDSCNESNLQTLQSLGINDSCKLSLVCDRLSILIASARDNFKMFDTSGVCLRTCPSSGVDSLQSLSEWALSPTAEWVLTVPVDGTIKLWRVDDGECLQTFVHDGPVWSARFSSTAEWVLTASDDGTAKLWSVDDGACLQTFVHDGPVPSARFSPTAEWVLTASSDDTVKLWSVDDGACLQTFVHDGPVRSARFSPTAEWVLILSDDVTSEDLTTCITAKLWSVDDGACCHTLKCRDASLVQMVRYTLIVGVAGELTSILHQNFTPQDTAVPADQGATRDGQDDNEFQTQAGKLALELTGKVQPRLARLLSKFDEMAACEEAVTSLAIAEQQEAEEEYRRLEPMLRRYAAALELAKPRIPSQLHAADAAENMPSSSATHPTAVA